MAVCRREEPRSSMTVELPVPQGQLQTGECREWAPRPEPRPSLQASKQHHLPPPLQTAPKMLDAPHQVRLCRSRRASSGVSPLRGRCFCSTSHCAYRTGDQLHRRIRIDGPVRHQQRAGPRVEERAGQARQGLGPDQHPPPPCCRPTRSPNRNPTSRAAISDPRGIRRPSRSPSPAASTAGLAPSRR